MVWGDGKQLHKNDITDYFGFSGVTADQLKQLGYITWCGEPQEKGSWISEGDTSMFMNLLDNGLDGHLEAGYGSWGGRNGKDIDPSGIASADYASVRWFGAAQRDFANRLQWTVTQNYQEANHPPAIVVEGLEKTEIKPGQVVTLKAHAQDPDGDHLTGYWWQYVEAGTYPGKIKCIPDATESAPESKRTYPFSVAVPGSDKIKETITNHLELTCSFRVPTDAVDGQTIHMISEVTDYAEMPMTAYKRVVLTVRR